MANTARLASKWTATTCKLILTCLALLPPTLLASNNYSRPLFRQPQEWHQQQQPYRYVGVMIDAGRHYFPIPWLENLLAHLYRLGYNLVHFRLTDDQSFALQLESHPELAFSSTEAVYTATELKSLVTYARSEFNITIIPEIDLPGHGGGWAHIHPAGIPSMIVLAQSFCVTWAMEFQSMLAMRK
jgi:hypothetical protein